MASYMTYVCDRCRTEFPHRSLTSPSIQTVKVTVERGTDRSADLCGPCLKALSSVWITFMSCTGQVP